MPRHSKAQDAGPAEPTTPGKAATPKGDTSSARSKRRGRPNEHKQSESTPQRTPGSQHRTPGRRHRVVYQPYLNDLDVMLGIGSGRLVRGGIRINAKNRYDAYVTVPGLSRDVYIDGVKARNRALEGDSVVVELLPRAQWKNLNKDRDAEVASESEVEGDDSEADSDTATASAAMADLSLTPAPTPIASAPPTDVEPLTPIRFADAESVGVATPAVVKQGTAAPIAPGSLDKIVGLVESEFLQPTGRVVRVDAAPDAKKREYVGVLKSCREGKPVQVTDKQAIFVPLDKRVPRICVSTRDIPQEILEDPARCMATLFSGKITKWGENAELPLGNIIKQIGEAGNIEAETQALITACNIEEKDYPEQILRSLDKIPTTIPAKEIAKRRDFRAENVFTIDPASARDLDDALHCKQIDDDLFEVGVHIADVSYYVKPHTPVDEWGQRRATSVYLVQKVIPMLPPMLSEHLCSLNPNVDRLSYSVVWKLRRDGQVVDRWFGRTVIRTSTRLNYDQAQFMITNAAAPDGVVVEAPHTMDSVVKAVLDMQAMAKQMRAKRYENGAISLNRVKMSFQLDENGFPIDTYQYPIRDSNKLVEEFMLLANKSVAERIVFDLPEASLLRRHGDPLQKRIDEFVDWCTQNGFTVDGSSSKALHESLQTASAQKPDCAYAGAVLQHLATGPMQVAKYICTSEFDAPLWHHYALNMSHYTHFTSPIRRYADTVVHRILTACLDAERAGKPASPPYPSNELTKIVDNCNRKAMNAKAAQEQSSVVFLCAMLSKHPVEEDAVVVSLGDSSFTILVPKFGHEQRVYLADFQKEVKSKRYVKDPKPTLFLDTEHGQQVPITVFTQMRVLLTTRANHVPVQVNVKVAWDTIR